VATQADTGTTEQIARSYFGRVAARDPDGMMEHWTPGGQGHIDGVAELVAPDSYAAWFRSLFAAFPDWQFEVLSITAEDDRAAVHWRATGTFNGTGSFEGVLPTGASIDISGIDLLQIKDGKLIELWAYGNGMELARQLGMMPPQGSAPERAMLGALNLKTRAVNAIRSARGS
jgi:predicted ester cyclase